MCEFQRTLHPVGHGAFFTEYIRCAGKSYNVVYDCGSLSKKILEKEIKEYYSSKEKEHIDLIFISHFDYDHINGLYFLVERGLITEETFVVIPYYYPSFHQFIGIQKSYYIEGINEMFRILRDANVSFVMVDNNEDRIENGPISLNLLSEKQRKKIYEIDDVIVINSGTPINIGYNPNYPFWIYIPFNYGQDPGRIVENNLGRINLLDDNKNIKTEELIDILHRKGKDDEKEELKQMYRDIEEGNLNANSLQLLSFCSVPTQISDHFSMDIDCCELCLLPHNWHCKSISCPKCSCSCLYTGDTNLNDKKKINFIKEVKRKYIINDLMMIQVPHHGSIYNYNAEIVKLACLAFVNYKPHIKKCSFHEGIYSDFIAEETPLIPITDTISYSISCHI